MRPQRFQDFAVTTLTNTPDVALAEPWQEADRPCGIHIRFATGSEMWMAISTVLAPGEKHTETEAPVHGDAPTEVPLPALQDGETVTPAGAERYLAAALNNSRSTEIARTYGYTAEATPTRPTIHPGVGVVFHSGARAFLLFAHTARAGQGKGAREFELQAAF